MIDRGLEKKHYQAESNFSTLLFSQNCLLSSIMFEATHQNKKSTYYNYH